MCRNFRLKHFCISHDTNKIVLRGCQTNDKISRFYLPTKSPHENLLCVMQKSPDFVGWQNRPILSAKIEHVLFPTIFFSRLFVYWTTNFVYVAVVIVYSGRWIFILVISCVCYLLSFIKCRKMWCKYYFCHLHSAVVLVDVVRSSRRKYRPCVMVHRFFRLILSGN